MTALRTLARRLALSPLALSVMHPRYVRMLKAAGALPDSYGWEHGRRAAAANPAPSQPR